MSDRTKDIYDLALDADFNRRMKLCRIVAKAYGDPNDPGFDDIEHEERVSWIVDCLMKEDKPS